MRRRDLIRAITVPVSWQLWARAFAVSLALIAIGVSSGRAQSANPFTIFGGGWTGSGFIHSSNLTKEQVRCRGTFIPVNMPNIFSLKVELRCAGDSDNFNIQSELIYDGNAISGTWSEISRGINGNVTGTIKGDEIQVVLASDFFTATFAMIIADDKLQINIQSPGSEIAQVVGELNRNSK
jgi:hypothetical protein